MSGARILVINPNSNAGVTAGIDAALDSQRRSERLHIDCVTLEAGPFGIESDADIDRVTPMVVSEIRQREPDYGAFVIACYSDPGLAESRSACGKTVLGIQESAVSMCATLGLRFGVLALGRDSIQRHIAYVRSLGMQGFHAGERPLEISVDDAANDPGTLERIVDVGRALIDEDGAEILILGCAGLARHRRSAQLELGVPVVDPVQAAVQLASEELGAKKEAPTA